MKLWMRSIALTLIASTAAVLAAEPTAHAPQYDNREVWPAWVEKTDFIREQWDDGRVLVYADAGESVRGVNLSAGSSWLEDGKPANKGPDGNTDVVFPASDKKYRVSMDRKQGLHVRHVTVEAGADISLGQLVIDGNLWVKKGGEFRRIKGDFGHPDKSTFCRSDNEGLQFIPNMQVHKKNKGKSTEWIGHWKQGDDVNIFSGRLIVAPDSSFLPTDRRPQKFYPGAELVLCSGSTFSLRGNQHDQVDLLVGGKILAGTPQRPLTKNATFGVSYKSEGGARSGRTKAGDVGLVLFKEGSIIVHSADPKKARLVLKWHERPNESRRGGGYGGEPKAGGRHGIAMLLAGELKLDGVVFEDVLPGGILLPDPAARASWKNVTYRDCHAPADKLFSRYKGKAELTHGGGTRWNLGKLDSADIVYGN